ncbi:MAG TPA: ABC transporter permease [Nocardioidaceae bacterium]|nr:ABC transporter permease [Nocardioidaceae bacterium]
MTSGGEASRGAPSQGRPPLALTVPAAVAVAFLALPVIGVLVKAPWSSLGDVLSSPDARTSLRLSLETTSITTVCCIVLGVPLAWLLARTSFRGRGVVRALVTLPLVMPPVVGGVALLLAFGRNGVVGKYLDSWFGITLPFTTPAVIVAQTFVALPFMVISVEGAFRASDVRYDAAAATLGASRWTTFRRVTMPLALPGIVSGAILSWARALGEFGATITFAGNFPGTTRTMPTQVYLALQSDPDAAIALSLALIVVSVAVLIALRERWLSGVAA